MKVVQWMTAVAGVATVLSVQAPDRALGAVGDAEVILYRFPGVVDNVGGGGILGVATLFHCTNFSGVNETIRIVVRDVSAGVVANLAITLPHLRTITFSTHLVAFYLQTSLDTGIINPGTAAIAATSTAVVCTAMAIDGSLVGVALHGIRFSPIPGTQE